MKHRTIALGALSSVLIALLLSGLFDSPPEGQSLNLAFESQSSLLEIAPPPSELEAPIVNVESRTLVQGVKPLEAALPAPLPLLLPGMDDEDEDPGTGVIFGNILDSDGARFERGRVLVFLNGRYAQPLLELKLEGPEMQFRSELPAGTAYRLVVDPESLQGDYTPALARSKKRSRPEGARVTQEEDLKNYTLAYVTLVRDREHRQDLWVGLPAQVSGRLLGADGEPLPGALARLSGLDKKIAGLSEDCITGPGGDFRFTGVFPGEHRLTFSRAEDWTPPAPRDCTVLGGADRWLGGIRAGGGTQSIHGKVLNQDGLPFAGLAILCYSNVPVEEGTPAHNMSSVLARTTTDAEGSFQLMGLPSISVKVSLTPGFEPGKVAGSGHPAMWEPNVLVDLSTGPSLHNVGTHTVEESRPFEITGRIDFDALWAAKKQSRAKGLRAHISRVQGQALPDGVRRVSLRKQPVAIDFEKGTFRALVETPNTEIELRFKLPGEEDLVYVLKPVALDTWFQEIRVPTDF